MTLSSIAIVTPSHLPDLAQCRLLVDSVRAFSRVPACHYLVVARQDMPAFAPLAGDATRLVELESLLPAAFRQDPRRPERWISSAGRHVSGWVIQQLAKLAFAAQAAEDTVMCVDSDTFFVRPFDEAPFLRKGRTRLFRVPGFRRDEYAAWTDTADDLLGIPRHSPGAARPNYVGNMITWRRSLVIALQQHVEESTGRPWLQAIGARQRLSEYVLYGEFVDRVLAGDIGHFHDATPLCHEYWEPAPMSDGALAAFIGDVAPAHIAMMISAKAGMGPAQFRALRQHFALVPAG